jgi:signal transduction histidine kinase
VSKTHQRHINVCRVPLKSGGFLILASAGISWQHCAIIKFRTLSPDYPDLAHSPLLRKRPASLIINISRMGRRSFALRPPPTSAVKPRLIEEAVLVNMDSADKYGVQFNIDCQDRSLTGFVDPQRFHQVMTNLLTNAAKFADKGSMIDVVVEGQANAIRVSICNEGGGIPVAFRDKIFKPFTQAAPSSTRARGGTGLGLHITKQIAEQTGGIIGFESPKGGRTKFWFTVPINGPSK